MSGLVKPKKYDWKDSNLALFGSDTEKQVKKESAQSEPAWQGSGRAPGLEIWRIEKFQVKPWPKKDYGSFFSGDSYIILYTYKEPDTEELKYHVHFWIGKESTQDEYGTAAYKTVELDTFHNDAPVQHREVEGHESDLFKSYFKRVVYQKGGVATGFHHVEPKQYKPRLYHITGDRRQVQIKDVAFCKSKLQSSDVYLLDMGTKLILWRGKNCNKDEGLKGAQFMADLKSDRCGKATSETVDDGDEDEDFWSNFSVEVEDDDDDEVEEEDDSKSTLHRVSDAGGSMKMTLEAEGDSIKRDLLQTKDVFILDTTRDLFVWIGKKASKAENQNAISYAHKYLLGTKHPLVPVTVLKESQSDPRFTAALAPSA